MASEKQRKAARRNVKKAQAGAKRKQTLKNMPKQTKTALGKEANIKALEQLGPTAMVFMNVSGADPLGTLQVYGDEILPRLRSG